MTKIKVNKIKVVKGRSRRKVTLTKGWDKGWGDREGRKGGEK